MSLFASLCWDHLGKMNSSKHLLQQKLPQSWLHSWINSFARRTVVVYVLMDWKETLKTDTRDSNSLLLKYGMYCFVLFCFESDLICDSVYAVFISHCSLTGLAYSFSWTNQSLWPSFALLSHLGKVYRQHKKLQKYSNSLWDSSCHRRCLQEHILHG